MAQAQPTTKVLRIGIVQDGKIIQERLIKAGEPVTVGESTKNTFVFPPSSLPKRYQLFVPKGKGYALNFTEEMAGKISYKNAIVSLDQLQERGDAVRKGGIFSLPLADSNRGKVSIDGVTILFQFVPPPPEPLRAIKQDFRPKLLDEDDPVFLGFLALWTAMAAVLMIVVYNAEPGQTKGLQEIPDRFTELVMDKPDLDDKPDIESEEPEIDENLEGPEVVKKETESSDAVGDADVAPAEQSPEQQEVAEAQRQEQAREEVLQESSLLMALLGTTGDANNGDRVQDLFSEDDWGGQNLDAALANVSGAEVATTNEVGVREAQGGGEGSADIGDLAKANTGGTGVGSGPATAVEGIVSGGTADIVGAANDDGVRGVIQRYRGQVKYCYDARLKENPTLQGRVDIMFTIARGRVLTASVLSNSTGDAALGDCIARKVQGWRFDSDEEAEVVYPFILAL